MRSNRTATVAFLYSCALLATVACGDDQMGPAGPGSSPEAVSAALHAPVKSISPDESANGLAVGTTRQLPPPAPTSSGLPALTWQSSNSSVADVSSSGVVTARSVGTTTITATFWHVAGTWTIKVIPSQATRIVLRTASLAIGDTASATIQSSTIDVSSIKGIAWTSADAKVATVSAAGLVKGVGAGSTNITASAGGLAITTPVTVAASGTVATASAPTAGLPSTPTAPVTPTAAPSAPAPAGSIALGVRRLENGSGTALVSNGIPLQPGALFPAQLRNVRVFVNGVEQSIYVEALAGTHPDGSLRTVLVEFNYPLNGTTAVQGQLALGQPRTTTDLAKPSASRSIPVAVALPTDPNYLVQTLIAGPTLTAAQSAAISSDFAKYESDFAKYADKQWGTYGYAWESANYYDRANIYYAWWARTGNVEYFRRATMIAVDYRKRYLEANNYGPSAYWYQAEGLEAHYLLTGDEASRTAVGYSADVFTANAYQGNIGKTVEMDNRTQGRLLLAELVAWRIKAPSRIGSNWASLLRTDLPLILSTESPDGTYRFTGYTAQQCGYNKPFMVAILNDALIKYNTYFEKDPRILPAVQKATDRLWNSDWISSARGFKYLEGTCTGPNGTDGSGPAADLNGLIVSTFGWMYQQTGNVTYRSAGDQVFAGGVAGAYLDGTKQFNENFANSFRYGAYRK